MSHTSELAAAGRAIATYDPPAKVRTDDGNTTKLAVITCLCGLVALALIARGLTL